MVSGCPGHLWTFTTAPVDALHHGRTYGVYAVVQSVIVSGVGFEQGRTSEGDSSTTC